MVHAGYVRVAGITQGLYDLAVTVALQVPPAGITPAQLQALTALLRELGCDELAVEALGVGYAPPAVYRGGLSIQRAIAACQEV